MRSANKAVSLLLWRSRSPKCPICLYAFRSPIGAGSGGHHHAFPAHHRRVQVEVIAHHTVAGEAPFGSRAAILRADLIDAPDGIGHLLDAVDDKAGHAMLDDPGKRAGAIG